VVTTASLQQRLVLSKLWAEHSPDWDIQKHPAKGRISHGACPPVQHAWHHLWNIFSLPSYPKVQYISLSNRCEFITFFMLLKYG